MEDKRILYVSSEVVPYLAENEVSLQSYEMPKMINDLGGQIRIFIPRYGNINERRHQLHEVIRLSGMNLVVNDMDMPLIFKVASIPKERIQVYFIDNDEYFKRKATFSDEEGVLYPDNDERAIFFAKGVVETVKKLNTVLQRSSELFPVISAHNITDAFFGTAAARMILVIIQIKSVIKRQLFPFDNIF